MAVAFLTKLLLGKPVASSGTRERASHRSGTLAQRFDVTGSYSLAQASTKFPQLQRLVLCGRRRGSLTEITSNLPP